MISLIPEYAPPGSNWGKFKILIGDSCVAEFHTDDNVEDKLEQYAADIIDDLTNLCVAGLLGSGMVTLDSLTEATQYMSVTHYDESEIDHYYTAIFRNYILQKYTQVF